MAPAPIASLAKCVQFKPLNKSSKDVNFGVELSEQVPILFPMKQVTDSKKVQAFRARRAALFAAAHEGKTMMRAGTKMVLRSGVWTRAA